MTQVTVDAELRSRLLNLSQPLDLCDESGRLIGMFMPISASPPAGYSEPPLSEDEWKRREQEPGCSTEEVLARLKRL